MARILNNNRYIKHILCAIFTICHVQRYDYNKHIFLHIRLDQIRPIMVKKKDRTNHIIPVQLCSGPGEISL
jgi:hypothetical protein